MRVRAQHTPQIICVRIEKTLLEAEFSAAYIPRLTRTCVCDQAHCTYSFGGAIVLARSAYVYAFAAVWSCGGASVWGFACA